MNDERPDDAVGVERAAVSVPPCERGEREVRVSSTLETTERGRERGKDAQ